MRLGERNILRFSRNILIEEIGPKGQQKIGTSSVLVAGAGGLGSAALYYLVAAGVGRVGIVDHDRVDWSNLQRQILFQEEDVGEKKALVAAKRLRGFSEDVTLDAFAEKLTTDNIGEAIEEYDFIVDGTDTFESKFLINDACVIGGKAFVHSGILRFEGQCFTVIPGKSGCLRCLLPEVPSRKDSPTCSEAGILGSVAGFFGSAQATEVLKLITGTGTPLAGKVMYIDTLKWNIRFVPFDRKADCPVCGENPKIIKPLSPETYGERCVSEENSA